MYKLPERRGGGGEVIWAMPERKHSFLKEVFPKGTTQDHTRTEGASCVVSILLKIARTKFLQNHPPPLNWHMLGPDLH